jgi:hypothetical protein
MVMFSLWVWDGASHSGTVHKFSQRDVDISKRTDLLCDVNGRRWPEKQLCTHVADRRRSRERSRARDARPHDREDLVRIAIRAQLKLERGRGACDVVNEVEAQTHALEGEALVGRVIEAVRVRVSSAAEGHEWRDALRIRILAAVGHPEHGAARAAVPCRGISGAAEGAGHTTSCLDVDTRVVAVHQGDITRVLARTPRIDRYEDKSLMPEHIRRWIWVGDERVQVSSMDGPSGCHMLVGILDVRRRRRRRHRQIKVPHGRRRREAVHPSPLVRVSACA